MFRHYRALGAALLFATGTYWAAAPTDTLMVIASPDGTQTTTVGTTTYYTRMFEVSLANTGQQPIDLSKGCFKAFDRQGASYALDIVDEALIKGTLKPSQHKKGDMGFSSLQPDVYNADVVRYSTDCTKQ